MKQLKEVKSKLKEINKWTEYKKRFKHKQMRLLTTKIALIFNEEISANVFYSIELQLINAAQGVNMFRVAFAALEKRVNYKADWESLGKFMWYEFQSSSYYYDSRHNIHNIFKDNNIIKYNEVKRKLYLKWLHSLDKKDEDFNNKIIQVNELVF